MSEIQNNNIPLIKITAPELNQSGYAANLSSTFDNIDKNFATLANYDFIKGESGRSISIVEMPFYDDNKELNDYGELVKSYFDNKYDEEKMSINGHDLFDNFTSDNAGTLHLIVERNNNTTDDYTVISSYYYIFLDGRFANDEVGSIDDKSVFEDVEDLSCILIYDKDIEGFKSLDNAFPTMYYEKGVGLCWKINGTNTGIAVQGIPGKDGKNAIVQYVECTNGTPVNGNESYRKAEVSRIYNYPNFTAIDVNTSKNDLSELNGNSSLILIIGDEDNKVNKLHHMYFGQLRFEDDKKLYAYYFESTELTKSVDNAEMINILKSISLNSRDYSPLRGLFIPISNANEVNNTQPVHLITATDILGEFENEVSGVNADLTLTPINDINTLNPDGYENKLLVEKYLYVDVDSSYYDGVLEYKLIAAHDDNNDLNEFAEYGDGLTSDNTKYLDSNIRGDYSDEITDSIPKDFRTATKYRWELITDNVSDDINTYFKYIFTTTITPNVSSEIMWFDGIDGELDDDGKYLIYGWSGNIENVIRFKKLTPVFVNSFKYDGDTSLNVNYNVNIAGDGENPNRDLTVNGSINCDNISVSGEADIRKIKDDIHMQKNAIIDGGVKIGKDSVSSSPYNTTIDINGNMTLKRKLQADSATLLSNLTSKDINSTGTLRFKSATVEGNDMNLLRIYSKPKSNEPSYAPSIPDVPDSKMIRTLLLDETNDVAENNIDGIYRPPTVLNAELNNADIITINKNDDNSIISSDVTSVNANSGVIVSNVGPNDGTFYYDDAGMSKNLVFNDVIGKLKTKTNSSSTSINQRISKQYEYDDNSLKSFVISEGGFDAATTLYSNILNNPPHRTISLIKYNDFNNKLFSVTIERPDNTDYKLYENTGITIKLGHYTFLVDLHSKGAHTNFENRWPELLNNNEEDSLSYINFVAYYKINEDNPTVLETLRYTFSNYGKKWYGYNIDKNIQNENTDDYIHRYQGYIFKLNDITILSTDINFRLIKDAYDSGKKIEIFICPSINMYFGSNNGKKINAAYISQFLPVDSSQYDLSAVTSNTLYNAYDLEESNTCIFGNFDPLTYKWKNNYSTGSSLNYAVTVSVSDTASTTICEDGVAIHSKNDVFGIGMYNADDNNYTPCLVYYNSSQSKPKFISLSDLFNKIDTITTTQEATVQTEEPENTELPELPE